MKKIYFIIIIIFFNFLVNSASVNVDEMKLIADTHYNINNQSMENTTYFNFISTFDGGYKFSSQIAFEGNTTDIENQLLNSTFNFNSVFLILRKAEIVARNLADSHLDLSLWTGIDKYLGAGGVYKGYLYYPETQDVDYVGYYRLKGTGITAQLKFWDDKFRANFHFYENTNFITQTTPNIFYMFSFDSEVGLYFDRIPFQNDFFHFMIELSGGATFPAANAGEYKVGLSFGIGNNYIDFFISSGLPKIDSNTTSITLNNFFISSYLHFKLAITDNTISFLTRPMWYNEQLSGINNVGEQSNFDINYKLKILNSFFTRCSRFKFTFSI